MSDLLVRLYALPPLAPAIADLEAQGIAGAPRARDASARR